MRFDPRLRLKRPIPGEQFFQEEPWIGAVFERLEPGQMEQRSEKLVPRRDLREASLPTQTRPQRRLARTDSPAPLLIRLIRHRFALSRVRGVRKKYRENQQNESVERADKRVDWHDEVRKALAERLWMRSTSPARTRPLPFTVSPSRWSLLPDNPQLETPTRPIKTPQGPTQE